MANPTMKIQEIIDLLMSNTGQNMSEDIMYQWFEEVYKMVREQKWSWNWLWEGRSTVEPSTANASVKWSGAEGSNNITLDGGGSVNTITSTYGAGIWDWSMTGRVFYWDERLYKVINSGSAPASGPIANKMYLDKPLHKAITSEQLSFCRQDYSYRTSSVKTVEIDFLKKVSSLNDDYIRDFMVTRYWTASGTPITWRVDDNKSLPTPKYAPVVHTESVTSSGLAAGTYYLFFTYVDQESGLFSAPGPVLSHAVAANNSILNWKYGEHNIGEQTYGLRLWRSTVNPERTRVPMYAVNGPAYTSRSGVYGLDSHSDYMWPIGLSGDKNPTDATGYVADQLVEGALKRGEMYYDGPWTTVDLMPCPDDIYSFDTYRLNNWGYRPEGTSYIDLGRSNQVLELLRLGVHQFTELQNRDTKSFREAIVHFRSQLMYLLKQDRSAASEDPGVRRHRDYRMLHRAEEYDPTKYWHWRS
tara:strand:+ start:57 stop:1469 length:1413 start_codon:yes stop_codon:yes gene_type:complete